MSDSATPDFAARYANAEKFLRPHVRSLIDSPTVKPNWIRDTDLFWYENVRDDRSEYVLVDAAARTKAPAFDHERLAEALKGIVDGEVEPGALEVTELEPIEGGLRLTAKRQKVEVALDTYAIKALGAANPFEYPSPDGRWALFVQENNLHVRDNTTDEVRQLTTDGEEYYGYGDMPAFAVAQTRQKLGVALPPLVVWSEDSSRFITYRLDQRPVGLMHIVRSSPEDGSRPQVLSYPYACAGDPIENLPLVEHLVIDVATGEITKAKGDPDIVAFVPPMAYGRVWWSKDETKYYVILVDRSDANVWLNEVDASTGDVRRVIEESEKTQFLLAPEYAQFNARTLSTGEVLWWAQRGEWGHLELHHPGGSVTHVTSGDWLVRRVVAIDEEARRVVFTAAGRLEGSDPYLMELCSVSLDGGEITTITSDGLDHDPAPAKHGRYFVDNTSRWDTPNVAVLRDSSGEVVMELEQADATKLYQAGWAAPERVVVKSPDGVTDIFCNVYKPHDFDPSKKYAVLDDIYPGPQSSACPLRFPSSGGTMVATAEHPLYNAMGFVVVVIDGRGSPLRTKSFLDAARLENGSLFVDDHAAAIQQLAETRPWMDLDRVGIFGHSAGGWGSTRAILLRPDVFKVAVSSCGNHDNRINHVGWAEKFYGTAEDMDYFAQSNVALADRLEGKLYLQHGEMDDNAVAHGTMRLVDALIAANKDFDFLLVPNAVHAGAVVNGYWVRKRWDYLVQHLMGETPPFGYRLNDIPVPSPF
ncbi:MAG TPA: DPP IV N-terminal domain-containing protein [Mycobacteriales bacterium]|nr:DPP IV N-terminal domain-containing protein [Mycobacteriales bacterium]